MNFLITLITVFLISNECDNNKNALKVTDGNQEKEITLIYRASSRAYFEEITVTKNVVLISNDRNGIHKKSYKSSLKDWRECLDLLAQLKVSELTTLRAPTSKRLHDGAAHASLTIKNKKGEIRSNSFDHGHPPEEIRELVEKLLSFKKLR